MLGWKSSGCSLRKYRVLCTHIIIVIECYSFSKIEKNSKNSYFFILFHFQHHHRQLAFVLISKTSMHVCKSGRQKTRRTSFMSSQTQLLQRPKFGWESEYYLDLENEDKKRYKEKSTPSNGELLPDPNISTSLLLICL